MLKSSNIFGNTVNNKNNGDLEVPISSEIQYDDNLHFTYPPTFARKINIGKVTVIKNFKLKLSPDMEYEGDDTFYKVGDEFNLIKAKDKFYVLIHKKGPFETFVTLSKEHFR